MVSSVSESGTVSLDPCSPAVAAPVFRFRSQLIWPPSLAAAYPVVACLRAAAVCGRPDPATDRLAAAMPSLATAPEAFQSGGSTGNVSSCGASNASVSGSLPGGGRLANSSSPAASSSGSIAPCSSAEAAVRSLCSAASSARCAAWRPVRRGDVHAIAHARPAAASASR